MRGELSGFSRAASGHCYFSLKDSDGVPALLRCAMFRRAASLMDFAPADGQLVEIRGRLGIYESRGELQMVVEAMQRQGAGSLYEEFLRRKAKLEAEGLFDPSRKRELSAYPQRLGVVTSLQAAALRDVVAALRRRAPHLSVVIYAAPVQGAEAPPALVQALQTANARAEVDALLLVRGGGSLEDLWAFNDERLVRAVASSALPVVCGVGHETDVTLCDLAADLRAATPTAAAELAAPAQAELLGDLQDRAARLGLAMERRVQQQAQRLDQLALRLGQPARLVLAQRSRLDDAAARLQRALRMRVQQEQARVAQSARALQRGAQGALQRQQWALQAATQRLAAQDPHAVLARGYAWVEGPDGRALVSAQGLAPGQALSAVWADGRAEATIDRVQLDSPAAT